jgi:hypothetical protein
LYWSGQPGVVGRHPELVGRAQRPGRLAQRRPGEQDHVRLPVGQHLLGLGRLGDQADRPGRDVGPASYAGGERHLVAGTHRDRGRGVAPGGDVDQVDAVLPQVRAQPRALLDVPAAVDPVGARDPHHQRHAVRDRGAHRVDGLEQQPDPVVEGAAVGVVAPVGQRREELVEQVAVGGVDLDRVEPGGDGRRAASANALTTSASSGRVSGVGSAYPSNATGEGATAVHPPSEAGIVPCSGAHGRYVEALRPAWASWTPIGAPWPCTKSTIRRQAAACSSFQMPASCGEIRPSGVTAEASVNTRPNPPVARAPRCTRCQSFGTPSTAEYWHIGASQTRLRRVSERRVSGSNKRDMRREPRARA